MLRLHTLGELRLTGEEGELLHGRRKELVLLTYLARRAPQPVPRVELATLLWGERSDAKARQSLRQALLHLKQAVPEGLEVEAESASLAPGVLELDIAAFERDVTAGRLADAVARWEGDFLTGAEDAGGEVCLAWVQSERVALRRRFGWALEQLLGEAERRRDWDDAIRRAEQWTTLFPLEERPATRLVEALTRARRGVDAVARHAAFVARFRQENDREPSPEFRRLGQQAAEAARQAVPRRTPGSTALLTPDMVGRGGALAELARAWQAARNGTATVVLVEGEPGIGKTRVCEEFLRSLAAAKEPVLRFSARGYGEAEAAYGTARQLWAGLGAAPGLSAAPAGALRELARLVPALRERFSQLPDGPEVAWSPDEAAAAVLAEVATETPVILFVDDLPAADPASRDLFISIARRLQAACVLLVLTGESHPLATLHGSYGAIRIKLHPLSLPEVATLVGSMLDLAEPDRRELVARVHRETGGVPLFVVETVAALLDEGHIVQDASGVWRADLGEADRPLPLPAGVREAVGRRLALLSGDGRTLAESAAVLALPNDAGVLSEVAGLGGPGFDAALEELLARRLLREITAPSPVYQFAHESSRRAAYELIPAAQRRRLHAAAARVLHRNIPPDDAGRAVVRRHQTLAGPALWLVPGLAGRRRAALLGALLVVVAGAAVVGWPRGLGFRERDWVVLADLDNRTGDSIFDQSLGAALAASLSQSRYVNVFPRARVRETLVRMRREASAPLPEGLAREVAQREGLRLVVALGLSRPDTTYDLTLRLVDPSTGADLARLAATAPDQSSVLDRLDDLARRLRRRLGESRLAVAQSVPLPQATTSSLAALKLYAAGLAARQADRYSEAVDLWEEAIALDSGFAWAHAALGSLEYWLNHRDNAAPHIRAALNLVDRLPERERLWLRHMVAPYGSDEAIRIMRSYLRDYPDDRDGWYNLGRDLQTADQLVEAARSYQRAAELDPRFADPWINIGVIRDFQQQPRQAVEAFQHALVRDSSTAGSIGGDLNRIFGFSYLRLGDSASARAVFSRLLAGDKAHQANGHRSLALLEMYYGRYRSGIRHLQEAVGLNAADGAVVSECRNRAHLARAYRALGDSGRAAVQLALAGTLARRGQVPPAYLALLVQLHARAGNLAEAGWLMDSVSARADLENPQDRAALELARGEVALARMDLATALEALQVSVRVRKANYARDALARAALAAGQEARAVSIYQEMIADSLIGWEVQEPWLLAPFELGRLYQSRADTTNAVAMYARFIERWRTGDPDLVALADARRRLAALRR